MSGDGCNLCGEAWDEAGDCRCDRTAIGPDFGPPDPVPPRLDLDPDELTAEADDPLASLVASATIVAHLADVMGAAARRGLPDAVVTAVGDQLGRHLAGLLQRVQATAIEYPKPFLAAAPAIDRFRRAILGPDAGYGPDRDDEGGDVWSQSA